MDPDQLQALNSLLRSRTVGTSGLRRPVLRTDRKDMLRTAHGRELLDECETRSIVAEIVPMYD